MSRVHVFADESGNFDFSTKSGASKYFILTTVTMQDCTCGNALLDLRRDLAATGARVNDMFHAANDDWRTRAAVLRLIASHNIRADTTILEKRKAQPGIRSTDERFYKMAWFLHFKHIAPRIVRRDGDMLVIAATVGTRARRRVFRSAVADVVAQVSPTLNWKAAALSAVSDPCLQIADYCSWVVQRKWESGKDDAFKLLASRFHTEFDVFRTGTHFFY